MILAIDPGPERSAWLTYDDEARKPVSFGIDENELVANILRAGAFTRAAIEMIASYGMPVGETTFETCVWIGRFTEASEWDLDRVYRRDVKLHLCNSARAKDANVRQALIDKFGPGREKAIGRKAAPGPLYGIKSDIWAALGVAVTYHETRSKQG